jgi:hypothetical protein
MSNRPLLFLIGVLIFLPDTLAIIDFLTSLITGNPKSHDLVWDLRDYFVAPFTGGDAHQAMFVIMLWGAAGVGFFIANILRATFAD